MPPHPPGLGLSPPSDQLRTAPCIAAPNMLDHSCGASSCFWCLYFSGTLRSSRANALGTIGTEPTPLIHRPRAGQVDKSRPIPESQSTNGHNTISANASLLPAQTKLVKRLFTITTKTHPI